MTSSKGCGTVVREKAATHHGVNQELLAVKRPSLSNRQQQSSMDEIIFVGSLSELTRINSSKVQLAVWQRPHVPPFVTKLSDPSIDAMSIPAFESVVTPHDVVSYLKSHLCCPYSLRSKKRNALNDDDMDELVKDIGQLVRAFADVSKSEFVNVKLEVIGDNGCQFWHQDSVPLRMVATYRGPCTEWVPPAWGQSTLRRRKCNSKHSQSLSHYDVALFKGQGETTENSPLLNQEGIVHRSPRIDGCGISRLVLVLDIPQEGWHF